MERVEYPKSAHLCLLLGLGVSGCNPTPSQTQINTRLLSPDRKLEAVYAEDLSGGPATGVYQDVYVVNAGQFPRISDRVFGNECVRDVTLRWEGSKILKVSYSVSADIQENEGRDSPSWFPPWLSASSPANGVQVLFFRNQLPAGSGC